MQGCQMPFYANDHESRRYITAAHFEANSIRIVGAADFDTGPGYLSPRRLPAWTRLRLPAEMEHVVSMPASVRIEFSTDADALELVVSTTTISAPSREPATPTFELQINGRPAASVVAKLSHRIHRELKTGEPLALISSAPERIRFERLGRHMKNCQIWLPHNAIVDLHGMHLAKEAELRSFCGSSNVWLHYGSSISQGMEVTCPTRTWPEIAARMGDYTLRSFAFAGQCHLDPFVARAMAEMEAAFISIKTGVNIAAARSLNTRTFGAALHGFLDTLRDKHPVTPILLISPIHRAHRRSGTQNDHQKPSRLRRLQFNARKLLGTQPPERRVQWQSSVLTLESARNIIERIVRDRRSAGDHYLNHLDGLSLLGPENERLLLDGIHPSEAGHHLIGTRFGELVFTPGMRIRPTSAA